MALPEGTIVRLNRHTRVWGGTVLAGGSPSRVMRLKSAAAQLFEERQMTISDSFSAALAERMIDVGIADPVATSLPEIPLATLTVVIPVKDRHRQLDRLLASIPAGVHETIVVDDGSDDAAGVANIVAAHSARLVTLPTNQGVSAARNAGMRQVETDFVVFVDSDVVVQHGSFETMLRHFVDPQVALVAPRVLGIDRDHPNWITRYEDSRSSLDLGKDAGSVRPRSPITWVSGTCMLVRASTIGRGFDPGMPSGEDVDFVWRLIADGYRVRFEPSAVVLHEHRTTVRKWLARKFHYGTGATPLAARHPSDIPPVVLPPWGALILALVLMQRRWSVSAAVITALAVSARIRQRIRFVDHPTTVSLTLTADGIAATLTQGIALLLRHWWPMTLIACALSRRARRATMTAALIDLVSEYARLSPSLDPARFSLARRLDDLSYGAGVWWSAIGGRSTRALLPLITRSNRSSTTPARLVARPFPPRPPLSATALE